MATKSEQERARADVRFAKTQKQAGEAFQAKSARDAQTKADHAKTMRLRGLRLAKEAAEAQTAADAKAEIAAAKAEAASAKAEAAAEKKAAKAPARPRAKKAAAGASPATA